MVRPEKNALIALAALAAVGLPAVLAQQRPAPAPALRSLPRSVSLSQQFVVYYPDRTARAQIVRRAEDVKSSWLKALQLTDEWKAPIVIQIITAGRPNAPRVVTSLFEGDGGQLKIQIDVSDPAVLRSAEFDLEIFRALCLEYIQRLSPSKAGRAFPQPPPWLLEGLYEDMMAARGEGIAAGLYDKLVDTGAPLRLPSFLKENPASMDATSRAVYRARSMALLRALLSLPGGARHLSEYLGGLSGINPADADKLMEKFPELARQPSDLNKIWSLALANASASDRVRPLGLDETSKQLAAILDLSAPPDPRKPDAVPLIGPAALQAVARSEPGRFILKEKAEDLMRLEVRAHPFLRPVVEEYRLIVAQLALKPKKNIEKRITRNIELERAVAQRGSEIEDYMNWFEAAKLDTSSKEFDSLSGAEKSPGIPGRTDAISRHLENLRARGW